MAPEVCCVDRMAQGDAPMTDQQRMIAQSCLAAAEGNTMSFPQIIGVLMEAGVEIGD